MLVTSVGPYITGLKEKYLEQFCHALSIHVKAVFNNMHIDLGTY